MSVVDRPSRRVSFDELPTFELDCIYDNWEDPNTVTVFSTADGDRLDSAWVRIDRDHARSLANLR